MAWPKQLGQQFHDLFQPNDFDTQALTHTHTHIHTYSHTHSHTPTLTRRNLGVAYALLTSSKATRHSAGHVTAADPTPIRGTTLRYQQRRRRRLMENIVKHLRKNLTA